jgi:cell division protein FtsW
MVYSATSYEHGTYYLLSRGFHLALGIMAFVITSRVRYTAWRVLTPGVYAVVLLGLVLVLIPGVGTESGGARRWLNIGFFGLQPSEFAKLAAILLLSCAVSSVRPGSGPPRCSTPARGSGAALGAGPSRTRFRHLKPRKPSFL